MQIPLRTRVFGCFLATTLTAVLASCGGSSNGNGNISNPPPPALTGVSITPSNPTIALDPNNPNNNVLQFKATGKYSDASTKDLTTSASWSSSDNSEATIQSSGVAKALKPGSPNIEATFNGITALTILDITCPVSQQTGISLSEINPSIAPGATLQFIAVVNCSSGSSQRITGAVDWSSSNPAVATVGTGAAGGPAAGLVTGVSPGTTTIKASYNGFPVQTASVTVANNAAMIPFTDMNGSQDYLGFEGGLYENSSTSAPSDHDTDGRNLASQITPLDKNGSPSSKGTVVFLGIGMSNATIEFSSFVNSASSDSKINHSNLAIENGAKGGIVACFWTFATGVPDCGNGGPNQENQYDRVRDTVLATATDAPNVPAGCGTTASPCLTEKQVQVIWLKNANPNPALKGFKSLSSAGALTPVSYCTAHAVDTEACRYEAQLGQIIRAAKQRYPNLKQIFLSTRIYAGYATAALNPEPYSYEYGFSAKWLIQAQIDQIRNSTPADPVAGDVDYTTAAWTAWGPYLWANGTTPRSDGLVWCNGQSGSPCNGEVDFEPDGTHPSSDNPGHDGATKVVNQMMSFFKTSPYTAKWFCASAKSCGP